MPGFGVDRSMNNIAGTLVLLSTLTCGLAVAAENPIEVGSVTWGRDHDAALAESARSGKPVFAFFQEVPGCAGCKEFGKTVMSHPLIVSAIEQEFVPLLIFNNRSGEDARLLETYGEPSWNYQVVRFLDAKGEDLIPRRDKVWTVEALAPRMIASLEKAGRDVPSYLNVAADELSGALRQAAFSQHCFWTGERKLGQVPGVITTEAGWLDGREVTLVRYHPEQVRLEQLVKAAAEQKAANGVYLAQSDERRHAKRWQLLPVGKLDGYRRARESDQKKQIEGTLLAELDLTPMQRTKVNAFARTDLARALSWLTPEQRAEFERRYAARGAASE